MKDNIHNKINKKNRKQELKNLPKHTRGMIESASFNVYEKSMDENKEFRYHEWLNKISITVYY